MFALSRFSLAHKSLIVLVSLAILLFGIVVIPLLQQDELPPVTYPAINVISIYPGASSEQVEKDVTEVLEQNLKGTSDVRTIVSQSREGISLVTLQYHDNVNLEQARQRLNEEITTIKSELPSMVIPQSQIYDPNDTPIILLSVSSSQNTDLLGSLLQEKVLPAIQGIDGVAEVDVTGTKQRIVNITVNVEKMQEKGILFDQVRGVLQANNLTMPAGVTANEERSVPIRVSHAFESIEDIRELIVGSQVSLNGANQKPNAGPELITLGEIATVEEDLAPSTTLTRVNGQPNVGIAVVKKPGGNTVAISQDLRAQIPDWEKVLGSDAKIQILDDRAPIIQSSISGLIREGLLGAAFAIIVIFVFLLSIRSTLVIALSIPLSIVVALIALWIQRSSLNVMTLAGLTIAIGRVVDDSIVVLENIHRHLQLGESRKKATLLGVKEVSNAVTASTLTTIAVFLPLAFISGLVGSYTHPLALTVTFALLASLIVSLTIIPVLAYWFLKAPQDRSHQQKHKERPSWIEKGYAPLVSLAIRYRLITIVVAVVLLIGSFAMFPMLPVNTFSNQEEDQISFLLKLAPDTSLTRTDIEAKRVEEIVSDIPEIQYIRTIVGSSSAGVGFMSEPNAAFFTVKVKPEQNIDEVQQQMREHLQLLSLTGTITFQNQSNNIVDVTIQASDDNTLRMATEQVMSELKDIPETTNLTSSLTTSAPSLSIQVDPQKAAAHGLTTAQVGQIVQSIYTGVTVTQANFDGVDYDVNLTIAPSTASMQEIKDVLIPGAQGLVRINDIATIEQVENPIQITHVDGTRAATITLTVTGQNVGGVTQQIQQRLAQIRLPEDATAQLGGTASASNDVLMQLILALLVAIPTVFIIMVATFRSILQPLILLVSIPFAAVGAIILAVIVQTPIGISTLFGFLMLIGIVVTNAVVLIDRVNQFRKKGMNAYDAVIAGSRQRVRPILMTALATILALAPMALGIGENDNAIISNSLAIIVIGGLTSSTILTLLFVPTLYVIVEEFKERLRPRKEKVVGTNENSDEVATVVTV